MWLSTSIHVVWKRHVFLKWIHISFKVLACKNEEIRNVHFFKGAFGQCEHHFNINDVSL